MRCKLKRLPIGSVCVWIALVDESSLFSMARISLCCDFFSFEIVIVVARYRVSHFFARIRLLCGVAAIMRVRTCANPQSSIFSLQSSNPCSCKAVSRSHLSVYAIGSFVIVSFAPVQHLHHAMLSNGLNVDAFSHLIIHVFVFIINSVYSLAANYGVTTWITIISKR